MIFWNWTILYTSTLDFKKENYQIFYPPGFLNTHVCLWNKGLTTERIEICFFRADSTNTSWGIPSIWQLRLHWTAGFPIWNVGPSSLHSAWQNECDCLRTTKSNIYFLGLFSQTSNILLSYWNVTTQRKEIILCHEFTITS